MTTVYRPNPGFAFNPLRGYRNVPCPCGSNKKAKRCHGRDEVVPEDMAKNIREYLRTLGAAGFIEPRKWEIG